MTGPVARVHELAGEALRWAARAGALEDAGLHAASLAAEDQAMAADALARKTARESGSEALIGLWDGQ